MEDDLKKIKMEDDLKKRKEKKEDDIKKKGRQTNQPNFNLIGCDTIVNSPSQTCYQKLSRKKILPRKSYVLKNMTKTVGRC